MREITRNDLQAALPDVTSPLSLPGLREPVQVLSRLVGHPPHPRRERVGPVLRPGLRHRPGPPLAHGRRPPPGPRPLVGDRRPRRPEAGTGCCAPPAWTGRPARSRGQQSGGPRHGPGRTPKGSTPSSTRPAPCPWSTHCSRRNRRPWADWHCAAVYKIRNTLLGTFEAKLFRTRLAARGPGGTARQANEGVSARQSAHRPSRGGVRGARPRRPGGPRRRRARCQLAWARSRPAPTAGRPPAG